MILFLMTLPVLFGLVGLAVDKTILYIVEAKLGAAVDGAALGAGRLLGTDANPPEIAKEFVNANFPTGYWGSFNLQPNTSYSVNHGLATINVSASVKVPLIFLRIFHVDSATVYASAVATRKTSRVVLVLDRSGSMNTLDVLSGLNVFNEMQMGAESFTGMFTPGFDEVGLVVFNTSAMVAYPTTRPYNNSPTSSGGPDTAFDTSSTVGPMMTSLQTMLVGGGTGTPEALALAYIELQKAHNRDAALNGGVDYAQNSIVLFTDGVPDSIAVTPNISTNSVISPSSPCQYHSVTSGSSALMLGTLATAGNPGSWYGPIGLFTLSAYDNNHTLAWWLANPGTGVIGTGDLVQPNPSTPFNNCLGFGNLANFLVPDMTKIPPYDYYGTSTNGSAYTQATLNLPDGSSTQPYSGVVYDPTALTNGNTGGIAAWNTTDNIGQIIRSQTAMQPITIYTIGYSGDGGTDAALLKRLANTQDAASYNSSQGTGVYIQVNSADQLGAAFNTIAGQLLRLSK
jgi:Flp pilus assembly protein TadG